MALIDAYMLRPDPSRPWMNEAERQLFKRLVEGEALSVFRTKKCGSCNDSVPNSKDYCSEACFKRKKTK